MIGDGNVTGAVIGAAITVHRELGPGLDEIDYEACLAYELRQRGFRVDLAFPTELTYRDKPLPRRIEIPMLVEGSHVVSCLCVKSLTEIHFARHRSLHKAARVETGLCLNFHSDHLANEAKRTTHIQD